MPTNSESFVWRIRYDIDGCARLVKEVLDDLKFRRRCAWHVAFAIVEIGNASSRALNVEPPPRLPRIIRGPSDVTAVCRWLLPTLRRARREGVGPCLPQPPKRHAGRPSAFCLATGS